MLEGGDRTVGIGEGGLEMGKDLRRRSAPRLGRQPGRQLGRRAPRRQCRADFALAQVEAFPDALPGPVTSPAVGDNADRSGDAAGDAAGDGAFEESPQSAGCQAQPSDFVREPDAEGPPASATPIPVAAKDPPSADRFSRGVALVVSAQIAVADQRANRFAMRTGCLLEVFRNRAPFLLAAAKPSLLAHVRPMPRENR